MLKRSVAVQIAGQKYVLKSDADEHYVHSLASYVDDRIREVQKSTKSVSTHQVAILAALQIADSLFREKRGRAELRKKVKVEARRLLDAITRETR